MQFNKPKTWLQHILYWPLLLLAMIFLYYGFETIYNYFFRKDIIDTLNNMIGTLIASSLFVGLFLALAFAIVRPKNTQKARSTAKYPRLFSGISSFINKHINKPKTGFQHLFYWPFLMLAFFFIYLDFELLFNYFIRQRSDDTLVYTAGMLILISLFVYLFVAMAAFITRPIKSTHVLLKENELIKKKEQGDFYGVKFCLSANSFKLGEKISVRLTGLNNQLLNKKPLALWFYCRESVGYSAGAVGGYTARNYAYIKKHPLTDADRSGGKIEFVIPVNMPPTYLELPNLYVEWFLRVEFVNRNLTVCHQEDGITSQELNVTPQLAEEAQFKIPNSSLPKIIAEEMWIELDGKPAKTNQPLVVEVGSKVSGRLIVLDWKQKTSAKKLSIELCFINVAYDDNNAWIANKKYHIRVPDLAVGERFKHSFEFTIPDIGPTNVSGGIFEANWSICSRTFFQWLFGMEPELSMPFIVVPLGGIKARQNEQGADISITRTQK